MVVVRLALASCSLVVGACAHPSTEAARTSAPHALVGQDGQHDFDFEIGRWRTHLTRLVHPLTGSKTWVVLDGTSVIRKVWNGRANLVELDVAGQTGHIQGLSLRLFHPQSQEWSLNFANSSDGTVTQPTIGRFANGRGEFFDHEPYAGKTIYVRNVFSEITPSSYRFEQAFSEDEGKTWEVNWIAIDTRMTDEPGLAEAVRAYDQAQLHNDVATLARLITDDYVLVNSNATVENKQQFLADFDLPGFKIDPYVMEEPVEQLLGDTAVRSGLVRLGWTQDGRHQTRALRMVYVWTKRDGRWQIAYTQVTSVPQ